MMDFILVVILEDGFLRDIMVVLDSMRQCKELVDVIFVVENCEIVVYCVILVVCSLYFRVMFLFGFFEVSELKIVLREVDGNVV